VIARVHREIADIARQPEMRERLSADGTEAIGNTPQEAARFIASEIATYTKLTKTIGLKAE
jgi:tripartite-type tricarboxylate transporter receptor subunit TctC